MSSHQEQIVRLAQSRMAKEAVERALDELGSVVVHLSLADLSVPRSIVESWIREIEQEKSQW